MKRVFFVLLFMMLDETHVVFTGNPIVFFYLCVMEAGLYTATKKMLVVRWGFTPPQILRYAQNDNNKGVILKESRYVCSVCKV